MRTSRPSRGAVLILVLWALLVLAGVLMAWVRVLEQQIQAADVANRGMEARALARSGVEVALHPQVTRLTPILEREFTGERRYRVQMVPEGGKLHLNWVLAGEDPRKLDMLKGLLQEFGLTFQEREVLVDSMLDWMDGDEFARFSGRDTEEGYRPANRAFTSVDELADVHGAEPLTKQPGWRDFFTLHSQGPVDVNGAPVEILKVIPGVGEARARRLVQIRQGVDEIDGTRDDQAFKTPVALQSFLGMSEEQFGLVAELIALEDPTFHIISRGEAGKVSRQVEAVVKKVAGSEQPTIILWKER